MHAAQPSVFSDKPLSVALAPEQIPLMFDLVYRIVWVIEMKP
jgi:hypothetical protein